MTRNGHSRQRGSMLVVVLILGLVLSVAIIALSMRGSQASLQRIRLGDIRQAITLADSAIAQAVVRTRPVLHSQAIGYCTREFDVSGVYKSGYFVGQEIGIKAMQGKSFPWGVGLVKALLPKSGIFSIKSCVTQIPTDFPCIGGGGAGGHEGNNRGDMEVIVHVAVARPRHEPFRGSTMRAHSIRRRRCNGHTLVELGIAAAMASVVLLIAFSSFVSNMRITEKLHHHVNVLDGAYTLLSRLEIDLRQAREISGRPFLKYGIRFSDDGHSISFRRPDRRGRQPGSC